MRTPRAARAVRRRRGGEQLGLEAVEALDRDLARISLISGSLRFALGMGLEALARCSGHSELGFSSLGAYVFERCERSPRWGEQSRAVVSRLAALPLLRSALLAGRINWSMAAIVSDVATPADEEMWLGRALTTTVQSMRKAISGDGNDGGDDDEDGAESADPMVTMTVTANREDIWLYEAACSTVREMEGRVPAGVVVDALVGEATSSLVEQIPREADLELAAPNGPGADLERVYIQQRKLWKREGEARCEGRILRMPRPALEAPEAFDFSGPPEAIDREIRRIVRALFERDVRIGELADSFWKADGWRRLGYGSAEQYSLERLGMSWSSIKAKKKLTKRLERLPTLATSVRTGELGFEAARIVSEVATPATEGAWVERAAERTLVHLREEVDIAEHASRVAVAPTVEPPSAELIAESQEARTRIATGASLRPIIGGEKGQISSHPAIAVREAAACSAAMEEQARFFERQRAPSRELRARGRATVRLRVPASIRAGYRALERTYARYRPQRVSFLAFASVALLTSHAHAPEAAAYGHIHARDGHRCQNPFCTRRDLTPHHIAFRSRGGTDDDDNVITLCVECHLRLVHAGLITVIGKAPDGLVWGFGRSAHTVVYGRRRVRAVEAVTFGPPPGQKCAPPHTAPRSS